jgi:anti-sigma regulatory factor (Ser/Thr protein kinase)
MWPCCPVFAICKRLLPTIVSCRNDAGTRGDIEAAMTFAAEPVSAGAARSWVNRTLGDWGYPQLADTVTLLTSELVTNVVRHCRTDMRVAVRADDGGHVVVEVSDEGPDMVVQREASFDDTSGRGLFLVNALSARWGVRRQAEGKSVWFEVDDPLADTRRR